MLSDKRSAPNCVAISLFLSESWGKKFNSHENIFALRPRTEVKIPNEWFKISENSYCNSNERQLGNGLLRAGFEHHNDITDRVQLFSEQDECLDQSAEQGNPDHQLNSPHGSSHL